MRLESDQELDQDQDQEQQQEHLLFFSCVVKHPEPVRMPYPCGPYGQWGSVTGNATRGPRPHGPTSGRDTACSRVTTDTMPWPAMVIWLHVPTCIWGSPASHGRQRPLQVGDVRLALYGASARVSRGRRPTWVPTREWLA